MSQIFLVHGPPGTGKTTYLSRQAQRAVAEHGPDGVAIASLTKAAAAEIGGRDTGIPDGNAGTLHSALWRALDRPQLAETPAGIRRWNAAHPAFEQTGGAPTLEDAPIEAEAGSGRTRGDQLHSAIMCHRARRTPREQWTDDEREYALLWDDFKQQSGLLDFTDLIDQALAELDAHPAYPKVLLFDEVQDFSALELALAQRWSRKTSTTILAGDTDQALYQWRGSDPEALLRTETAGHRVLEQSYRVPAAVHALADRWVRQIDGRADVAYRPTDAAGEARRLPISLKHADPLLAEIRADLDAGRTVMVLAACSYMLSPIVGMLKRAGVPFHNPYRVTAGQWNPMRAAGPLLAFLRPDERVHGNAARAWTWDDLRRWTDPLTASGTLTRGAKSLIESKCQEDRFGESSADVEVPTETLVELLGAPPSNWASHRAFHLDVDWWASRLRAKEARRLQYVTDQLGRLGPAPLADAARLAAQSVKAADLPWVTVGTIHSVKGGEADSVYVFPDLSKQGFWGGWQTGGAGRDQIVRMIYVALTRAKERVTILDPAGPEHVPLELLGGGDQAPERRRAALGPTFGKAAA